MATGVTPNASSVSRPVHLQHGGQLEAILEPSTSTVSNEHNSLQCLPCAIPLFAIVDTSQVQEVALETYPTQTRQKLQTLTENDSTLVNAEQEVVLQNTRAQPVTLQTFSVH